MAKYIFVFICILIVFAAGMLIIQYDKNHNKATSKKTIREYERKERKEKKYIKYGYYEHINGKQIFNDIKDAYSKMVEYRLDPKYLYISDIYWFKLQSETAELTEENSTPEIRRHIFGMEIIRCCAISDDVEFVITVDELEPGDLIINDPKKLEAIKSEMEFPKNLHLRRVSPEALDLSKMIREAAISNFKCVHQTGFKIEVNKVVCEIFGEQVDVEACKICRFYKEEKDVIEDQDT